MGRERSFDSSPDVGYVQEKRSRKALVLPPSIARHFDTNCRTGSLVVSKSEKNKPKSFGVYLGQISNPTNVDQARLLSEWDLIILDPLQSGVLDAVANSQCASSHILARLDLGSIVQRDTNVDERSTLRTVETATSTALMWLRRSQEHGHSSFTGILLAQWDWTISLAVCNRLVEYLAGLGFEVYLELSAPEFLGADRTLKLDCISGLVVRNASILPHGERRDFFKMAKMTTTIQAMVGQSCLRPFNIMMWETIDDEVELSHAVVRRSLNWCRFYGALAWIGKQSALSDASKNVVAREPLGAFDWLKDENVMHLHETWRLNQRISVVQSQNIPVYEGLEQRLPNIVARLSLAKAQHQLGKRSPRQSVQVAGLIRTSTASQVYADPLSRSPSGLDQSGLGCFPIGFYCSSEEFDAVLTTQSRLRSLELLETLLPTELHRIGEGIQALQDQDAFRKLAKVPKALAAIDELVDVLLTSNPEESNGSLGIRVYLGLDSGFQSSSQSQFWSVYEVDEEDEGLNIFISKKAQDLVGIILHTFLSSRGCTRPQCFAAEVAWAEATGAVTETDSLPLRLAHDVEMLSPSETLLFLQHMARANSPEDRNLLSSLRSCCEYQLMDLPSLEQLGMQNTTAYLRGDMSAEELVQNRLDWHVQCESGRLDIQSAVFIFKDIDALIRELLEGGRSDLLEDITTVLESVLQEGQIDASGDLIALSVFCSIRRAAFEEIYLDVTDRNPLFNDQADQAAAFSELFALGSRCESYFGMTPSVFGKILSDRYRAYYKKHQPPEFDDSATVLATTYAAAQLDIDPEGKPPSMPFYQQITFLSIFAIPALIDILLLTTTGRGLYLSAFMGEIEQKMATLALMIALLLSGAVGTWIGCLGSYYMFSMAFAAMSMSILSRFVAGVALSLLGAVLAFPIIIPARGAYAAVIFFLYFMGLTLYLFLMAILANLQYPGYSFQSGKGVIVCCMPILLLAPIVTAFVQGHDIVVYLSVLYAFVTMLLFGARRIISQWCTWFLKVPTATDADVLKWYITNKAGGDSGCFAGMTDPAALRLARETLFKEMLKEHSRPFWRKSNADDLIRKLAKGYPATKFLFDWYCRHSNTKLPYPFSSTWNIQAKVALQTLQSAQKGIRLHNGFIHWRYYCDEVGAGILYFLVALLDKWIDLATGVRLVGLSAAANKSSRIATGFGLAYYLVGAVILDIKAQALYELGNQITPQRIHSVSFLKEAAMNDAKKKRRLYWATLLRFVLLHFWGLGMASALIWGFDGTRDAMIIFLSYATAYSGLLWYQYNKIFSGPHTLKPLLVAVAVGLPIGFVIRRVVPLFAYNSVIALGVATWIAALLALRSAKVGLPTLKDPSPVRTSAVFHSHGAIGTDFQPSQKELSDLFKTMTSLSSDACFRVASQNHPGVEITSILENSCKLDCSKLVSAAFPERVSILKRTAELWRSGKLKVDLVATEYLVQFGYKTRAISKLVDADLHIVVGVHNDYDASSQPRIDVHRNCSVVAEALVHAVAELILGLSHSHAVLAESLIVDNPIDFSETPIPQGICRQLEFSSTNERFSVMKRQSIEVLHNFCLGIDCDRDWAKLPEDARSFLLKRVIGARSELSASQLGWLKSITEQDGNIDINTYVSRCDLAAALAVVIGAYAIDIPHDYVSKERQPLPLSKYAKAMDIRTLSRPPRTRLLSMLEPVFGKLYHGLGTCIKFLVIALIADPEFQRELDYVLSPKPAVLRYPLTFLLNHIWIYSRFLQRITLPFFLFHGRLQIEQVAKDVRGMKTVIKRKRVVIESMEGPSTGFIEQDPSGNFRFHHYSGRHTKRPKDDKNLIAINSYSHDMLLHLRQEYKWGSLVNEFQYEYSKEKGSSFASGRLIKEQSRRVPIGRRCTSGLLTGQQVEYDRRGFIQRGSVMKGENLAQFKFQYRKGARFDDELLRAEYTFPHMTVKVAWCAPPNRRRDKMERWIPHSKVTETTIRVGWNIYKCKWLYDHKFHPVIFTTLNGEDVPTPPIVQYDWLDVFKKPMKCSFVDEDPLFYFRTVTPNWITRSLGLNSRRFEVSTSRARTHLWKTWKGGKELDGVIVRWLDERTLRSNSMLKPYWAARDRGSLDWAKRYLTLNADAIMASVDLDGQTSSWMSLAFKMSDFYTFGQGGDAVINTRTTSSQLHNTDNSLHVLATDTGTWPNEGGGVSACRRDLVNNLRSIRWHMVVESANDFGLPKYQIEENVQSLKVLPLWGMDFLTPTHGIFQNSLDSAVQEKFRSTTDIDIEQKFLPILTAFVTGARSLQLDKVSVERYTKAFVDLNDYFGSSRLWNAVWSSDVVKNKWRELWLTEEMENTRPASTWFNTEHPTLSHLDQGLELWYRYLFMFSIPVPEEIPSVFQASHHSVSASYGIVCKLKRNCTLQVWDHAISWRETNLYLSSALCFLSPFVRNCLIGLMRLTSVLVLHHADTVLPCADFFNPGWEVEIGTSQGALQHRRTFARKVDPVVNGICDMERFKPIEKITSTKPTVTMLSHVWYAKDIKIAILAADVIVNEWGFKDYRLDIYGALDKAPTYSTECQEIVASKALRDNCVLRGTADPAKVLEETWVFMNSSISEGLPLALGEAALAGAPIVCTDVGASLRVLTDPDDLKRYSAVVAPNDVRSLARAQIQILAMIGEWAQYAEDDGPAPVLPASPSPGDVRVITQRMYDKGEDRRKLGMMAREIVQKSFSGDRYLREHEQMLWIGKHRSKAYQQKGDPANAATSYCDTDAVVPFDEKPTAAGWNTPDPNAFSRSTRSSATAFSRLFSKWTQPHGPRSSVGSGVVPLYPGRDDESRCATPVMGRPGRYHSPGNMTPTTISDSTPAWAMSRQSLAELSFDLERGEKEGID
ncbi:MAG: hypothetical protein M1816_006156 [Peltula sp. TS41687]|nr:MAG: hypothetical protein M1816_006156 [Peltula sp. TS41687]